MKKRLGTILLIILFVALLSVLLGCVEKDSAESPTTLIQPETITSATSNPSSTPVVTPTATSAPTPSPKPTPSAEDELLIAPDVAGLEKGIQDGKIVYIAMEGNEYGIDVGEVAGTLISKDSVFVEGNPTGGIELDPRVVKVLLDNSIADIPTSKEDKLKIVLPLDTSVLSSENRIMVTSAIWDSYNVKVIEVSSNKSIRLINSTYCDNQFYPSDNIVEHTFSENGKEFDMNCPFIRPVGTMVPYSAAEAFKFIFYYGEFDREKLLFEVSKGSSLGVEVSSPLVVMCGGEDTGVSLDTSDLLYAGSYVVFMLPAKL